MPNVIRFPKPHRVAPFSLILHCHDQNDTPWPWWLTSPGALLPLGRPSRDSTPMPAGSVR